MFGINAHQNAGALTARAMHALQHRGPKSSDIVLSNGTEFFPMFHNGPVIKNFSSGNFEISGYTAAIGQVHNEKYNFKSGAQAAKIMHDWNGRTFPLATDGALTNRDELGALLGFRSTDDSKLISGLIAAAPRDLAPAERVAHAMRRVLGAASVIAILDNHLIAARDAWGGKPLVMGTLDGATVFAGETAALYAIGATYGRDVAPGEIISVQLTPNAVPTSMNIRTDEPGGFCAFEYIYTARPDARFGGLHTREFREKLGAKIAASFTHPVDVVVPVPDSGVPAATGFANALGKPLAAAILRNHFGRSFTEKTAAARRAQTQWKLSIDPYLLRGRDIALVDDSIVRGNVMENLVSILRAAGVGRIHVVSSCPEIRHPCFYGGATRTYAELIAARLTAAQIAKHIGADSVTFPSCADLNAVLGGRSVCDACMTGNFKIPMTDSAILEELKKRKN